jgi:hypothetical protein
MRFNNCSRLTRRIIALALAAGVLTMTACGQNRDNTPLSVTITQGEQFAHRIELPSGFRRTNQDTRELRWFEPVFDHYAFRLLNSSPDVLLVAACRYENPLLQHPREVEICSENSFSIDTAHSYVVQEAKRGDWQRGAPIDGFLEMNDPVRRTLKQEMAKPSDLRALPIGSQLEYEGYRYVGKSYIRRAKWMTALSFGTSVDGKLIVLAGYDRKNLSNHPFALDVFDSDPAQRIVAIDAESRMNVENRLAGISIVSARWLVVGLDLNLQHLFLFDFKPLAEQQIK